MMRTLLLGVAASFALATGAHAFQADVTEPPAEIDPSAEIEKQKSSCVSAAENNAEYFSCYNAAINAYKVKVKEAVALLADAVSSPDGKAAVDAEQRAFQAYADKACALYWTEGFGTMHSSIVGPNCIAQVWQERLRMVAAHEPEG